MTRRSAIALSAVAAVLPDLPAAPSAGRLKQSFARWCYAKIPLDDLCRQAADMGCTGIDLIDAPDWPLAKKYGLTPAMTQGEGKIPFGWNHKENHEVLEKQLRVLIAQAADAKLPNVITFSGNRKGMSDDEGKANCIEGLRRVVRFAEDSGVTICMELLNSKINHKDYQADHTAWGVEVCKGVDSPRLKLLYDIYHMQIMEGDVIHTIRDNIQYIGHFHTGGVPGRHELDDTQELQWRTIAKAIADLNFTGFFAHEFQPTKDPLTSLKQAVELCTV
jgi:hydroxypyruvate isomerase